MKEAKGKGGALSNPIGAIDDMLFLMSRPEDFLMEEGLENQKKRMFENSHKIQKCKSGWRVDEKK
jgi:hypothetical protein